MNVPVTKIAYCISSLHSSGGTERVVTVKCNYLSGLLGYKIFILVKNSEKEPFFSLSSDIEVINLNATSENDFEKKLSDTVRLIAPHIIISTGGSELPFLPLLRDGSKKVFEFHYTKNFLINFVKGISSLRFKRLHLLKAWLLQKRIFIHASRFDKIILLTKRDKHLWNNPSNALSIYNPLSFRSTLKSTTKNKIIIAVGSFTPAKGMDRLIEAFGRVAYKHPEWRLEIYGSGQDYLLLKKLIEKFSLCNRVSLNSPCENIQEKLLNAGIYAFPSRSDGFGLVLTEAMECGLPSVAFDCECGPREILSNKSGVLVPQDDISSFAEALEKLMSDSRLREEMGYQAQKEVSRFYLENIMPEWIKLFEELKADKL